MKNKTRFLLLLALFLASFNVKAQDAQQCAPLPDDCSKPVIVNLGDKNCNPFVYTPAIVGWTGTPGVITSYFWTVSSGTPPPGGTWPPAGPVTLATPIGTCITYSLGFNLADGPNLIQNGGFQTEYDCSTHHCFNSMYSNGCFASGESPGHIKVGDFTSMAGQSSCGWVWANTTFSHTDNYNLSGTRMLIVNGMTSSAVTPYFWGQTVDLCAGQKYRFSYWVALWEKYSVPSDLPNISVITGPTGPGSLEHGFCGSGCTYEDTHTFGNADGSCEVRWEKREIIFTAGAGGSTFICLHNSNYRGKFAVDDIELHRLGGATSGQAFRLCPPNPITESISTPPCICEGDAINPNPINVKLMGTPGDEVQWQITNPGLVASGTGIINAGGQYLITNSLPPGNYTVTIIGVKQPGCNAFTPVSISKNFTVQPKFLGAIEGPSEVCVESSITLTNTVGGGSWTIVGASLGSGITSAGVFTAGSTIGTVTVKYTVSNCCSPLPKTKVITIRPKPDATVTALCVCSGAPISFSVPSCTGCSYSWNSGAGTAPTFGLPAITSVPCGQAIPASASVIVTNEFGCSAPGFGTVMVYPMPEIYTHSPMDVDLCGGDATNLTVTGCGGGTYDIVSVTGDPVGGTLVDALDGTAVFTAADVDCETHVHIKYTIASACTSSTCTAASQDFYITITPHAKAEVEFITCTTLCPGMDVQFVIHGSPGAVVHYQYAYPGCPMTTATETLPGGDCATGVSSATITLPYAPCGGATTGIFTLEIIDAAAPGCCPSTINEVYNVTIGYPTATLSWSGILPCIGDPYSITITGSPGARVYLSEYMLFDVLDPYYDLPMGPAGTMTSRTITGLVMPPGGTYTYGMNTFCITKIEMAGPCVGCTVENAESYVDELHHPLPCLNVSARSLPQFVVAPVGVCPPSPFTFEVLVPSTGVVPIDHLAWSGPGGFSATTSPISAGSNYQYVSPGMVGPYVVTAFATNGCTATKTVNVLKYPDVVTNVKVTGNLCERVEGTFYVTVTGTPGSVVNYKILPSGITGSLPPIPAGGASYGLTFYGFPGMSFVVTSITAIGFCPDMGSYSYPIPVYPMPAPIAGPSTICNVGGTITLTDAVAGGTWSSGSATVADVDLASGVVTAYGGGTATITYTTKGACAVTKVITVAEITGSDIPCGGTTTTLSANTSGGFWYSSNPAIATVDASGVVTAVSPGIATISYSAPGCFATFDVTSATFVFCPDLAIIRNATSTDIKITAPAGAKTSGYFISSTGPCGSWLDIPVGDWIALPPTSVCTAWAFVVEYINLGSCSFGPYDCTYTVAGLYAGRMATTSSSQDNGVDFSDVAANVASLALTPNPNNGTFKLSGHLQELMNLKEVTIEIDDILGKTLLTETVPVKNGNIESNIAMREVANGVYMVKIKGEHVNHVLRCVIDK